MGRALSVEGMLQRGLTVSASGAGGRRWLPLLVAVFTLTLPLGTVAWQASEVPPPAEIVRPTPIPEIVVVARLDPTPTPVPPAPAATPLPTATLTPVQPPSPTASPPPVRVASTGESSFNFLLVGVDRRNDLEVPRTDTIMIGTVDLASHRLMLVSVPRDLQVDIPGYGQDRINAAYVYGEQFGERDGGIGMLRRTIEWNFGIPIQHFGLIDFQCFRTAVDAVGGVIVDVPRTIVDTRYPTEDYGYKTVRFDQGPHWLDGERALEYARTRNPDNDFGRIRRQQQVVTALRSQVLQLRSLPAVPTILSGCRNLRTDLGVTDYVGLANALRSSGDGMVALRTIDERMAVEATTTNGAAVLLPQWEAIGALVHDMFPSNVAPSGRAAARN